MLSCKLGRWTPAIVLAMASIILVVDLFLPEDSRRNVVYWLSLAAVAGTRASNGLNSSAAPAAGQERAMPASAAARAAAIKW